jgi:hypothetical protein
MSFVFDSRGHLVGDGTGPSAWDILGKERDPQPLLANDLAVVRLEFPADQPQERALPLTVAAHQADPLARFDLELDLIQ